MRLNHALIAGALAAGLFLLLQFVLTTTWAWYYNWLIAAGVVAFVYYGIDKGLAKTHASRVPEAVLHGLALIGGFAGALLGMVVFHHKTNTRAHPLFLPIIFISAGLWGFVIYRMMSGA
jgi:uncharacterized membrane protein YsdA (DUF1294 family)